MSWRPFGKRKRPGAPAGGDAKRETLEHLRGFAATRVGVEAYIEPPNAQIQTTLLLVATTGEWTRRKVPDAATGRSIAVALGIPVYDVNFTGYPQRMRDWTAAQRAAQRQAQRSRPSGAPGQSWTPGPSGAPGQSGASGPTSDPL
ncbi:MAG: oxidoreductase [Bifidobacteriaceae bacterium]|nr:oxidoreductase [Bifidobacteriaceae bacterium]